MKKIIISEELVDPQSLTNLKNLDMSGIKYNKTNHQLLMSINSAAEQRKQQVTLGNSTGNSVEITKISDKGIPPIPDIKDIVSDSDAVADKNSPYNRVKYFLDILKNLKDIVSWENKKIIISKIDEKPTSTTGTNAVRDLTAARQIFDKLTPGVDTISSLDKKSKNLPQQESIVTEEINRIKQLMK